MKNSEISNRKSLIAIVEEVYSQLYELEGLLGSPLDASFPVTCGKLVLLDAVTQSVSRLSSVRDRLRRCCQKVREIEAHVQG